MTREPREPPGTPPLPATPPLTSPPTADEATDDALGLAGDAGYAGTFEITIAEPGAAERSWRFTGEQFSVGSHPSNQLVLADAAVSRFHCEVRCDGDVVSIRDLGSRNGTFVDAVRIKEAFLRRSSSVQVGRVVLRVGAPPAAARPTLSEARAFGGLVGGSAAMRAAYAVLERAAQSQATVLLEGETGTGKGEAALGLHTAGARRQRPFVVVDCGAIADNLVESELFGHERGAFTGAEAQRIGAFEAAAGGTIFLDEVGELPLDVQPKLLRALEERQIRRLGSTAMRPVDVRIVAASNRDLRAAVNDGSFRADLFYRLAVVRVRLPPLRERLDDLGGIVARLLEGLGAGAPETELLTSEPQLAALRRHGWPGNVRELRNHLERCLVLEQPSPLGEPAAVSEVPPFQDARGLAMAAFERQYLERLIAKHDGKVAAAAETARLSRVYLYRLLGKYGLLK